MSACAENLRHVYHALVVYRVANRSLPDDAGARFLGRLWHEGAIARSADGARRLTCPGPGADRPETSWELVWSDLDAVDGSTTAYAARDQVAFPLASLEGREPLVACDNDGGMNHPDVTNVLYADGSVEPLSLAALKHEGLVAEDVGVLVVGPDSPLEVLRKLSLD